MFIPCCSRSQFYLLATAIKGNCSSWVVAFGTPQQVALRCRIVLAAACAKSDNVIAQ